MKIKDTYRIAKIYMRSNKQKNNLIINFSTTLITFIIIAFLFISMYIGFIKKCDSVPYSNYGNICYFINTDKEYALTKFNEAYGDDPRITDSLLFYGFSLVSEPWGTGKKRFTNSLPNIIIDDVLYKGDDFASLSEHSKMGDTLDGIRVSSKENKSIYLEDDVSDFHKNNQGEIILAGSKKVPDKGEIFVPKFFCDELGLSYEDIIGKSFSIYVNMINNDIFYFAKNFIISGVYNSDYKSLEDCAVPSFIISELSLASSNELNTQENHIDGLLYLPYPMTINNGGIIHIIVSKNVVDACSLYKDITAFASRFDAPNEGFFYAYHQKNTCLWHFYEIYPVLSSLITFGTIVGIALLFICILKLLGSILYYINQNKEYFGMLKSLGMSTGDIIKLSLLQIIHIFLISSVISIVVSFIFCIIFTNVYNSKILKESLHDATEYFEEACELMKINFADYFTSCSIIISISFILISLFTIVLSYKTSKKNAVTLLRNYNN